MIGTNSGGISDQSKSGSSPIVGAEVGEFGEEGDSSMEGSEEDGFGRDL